MKTEISENRVVDIKRIKTCIKVCDRFTADVIGEGDVKIGVIENQYVPDLFPGQHYGDYLELDIDIETGKILNWKPPFPSELEQLTSLMDK